MRLLVAFAARRSAEIIPPMVAFLLLRVIPALWLAWLAYWLIAARGNKPTERRADRRAQLGYRVISLLATLLLFAPRLWPLPLDARFLPRGLVLPILGTGLLALGLAFSIWARRQLGRNWSASVEIKQDHVLIRRGPYRYVRHPIYSGALLALFGTMVAVGEWRTLLGFALFVLSFAIKARLEESYLSTVFPDYAAYRRETAALIPFLF
jgi:protein-S-isoprenylcysteine O-methyltransferase Ste14